MKDKIMKIMQEHGYSSQRAVARALHEKVEYYKSGRSSFHATIVFLNQVLLGNKPLHSNLAEGLVQLCEGDESLIALLETLAASKNKDHPEYHLTRLFDLYLDQLRIHYQNIDNSQRLRLLTELQSVVERYTGLEAKVNENPV